MEKNNLNLPTLYSLRFNNLIISIYICNIYQVNTINFGIELYKNNLINCYNLIIIIVSWYLWIIINIETITNF